MDDATVTTAAINESDQSSLLRSKEERIASLERQKQKQDEVLSSLRSDLSNERIRHKEDTYWLRLEVENLRADKEALEDRIAELYRDMREIDAMNEDHPEEVPVCVDSSYVLHLQSQLSLSMQTMGVLDNQIGMVKRSCDEVVKSLKEEIQDVMDDKCRVEVELMNQLAKLDGERRNAESEAEEAINIRNDRLKSRDNTINALRGRVEELKAACIKNGISIPPTRIRGEDETLTITDSSTFSSAGADTATRITEAASIDGPFKTTTISSSSSISPPPPSAQDFSEWTKQRDDLLRLKDKLADSLHQSNTDNERLQAELRDLKSASTKDAQRILDLAAQERAEAEKVLEKTSELWERADESVLVLEDVIDELRPSDDDERQPDDDDNRHTNRSSNKTTADRERARSTLETAALIHGQVKASLLLVELRLRNHINSLRSDRLVSAPFDPHGDIMAINIGADLATSCPGPMIYKGSDDAQTLDKKSEDIRREALDSIDRIESGLTEQLQSVLEEERDRDDGELDKLRDELEANIHTLETLQGRHDKLVRQYDDLGRQCRDLERTRADAESNRILMERRLDDAIQDREALETEREDLKVQLEEKQRQILSLAEDISKRDAAQDEDAGDGLPMSPTPSTVAAEQAVTQAMFEQLQTEIFSVVAKIKEKNDTIGRLTVAVEEHKVREAALKKELKRIMKRVRAIEEGERSSSGIAGANASVIGDKKRG